MDLPKEVMLMDTLMHSFEITTTAAQSASATRRGTFFPRNGASIIDTITVFINGQVFENIYLIIIYSISFMIIPAVILIINLVFVLLNVLTHPSVIL
jgi:hypothetical protein